MSAEHTRVTAWIWDEIQSDATVLAAVGGLPSPRIYADEAPQGAITPMVLYAFLGGSDQLAGGTRLSNAIYIVRVVGEGSSYTPIEDLADRVDNRLTNVGAGGIFFRDIHIIACTREQPHQRKDAQFGIPTVYLGGLYRIRWSPVV